MTTPSDRVDLKGKDNSGKERAAKQWTAVGKMADTTKKATTKVQPAPDICWLHLDPWIVIRKPLFGEPETKYEFFDMTVTTETTSLAAPKVVKESYVIAANAKQEISMFKSVQGLHGIPELVGAFIYNPQELFSGLDDLVLDPELNSKRSLEHLGTPEFRVLVRLTCCTKGSCLMDVADQPHLLVRAVMDAMLGHFHIHRAGWLHRDISVGNILLRHEKKAGPVVTTEILNRYEPLFESNRDLEPLLKSFLEHAWGFIIDGDLAVECIKDRKRPKDRSGTLPFMAYRVLNAWSEGHEIVQNPIDDLESFAWLLFYVTLHKADHEKRTDQEQRWISALSTDDPGHMATFKYHTSSEIFVKRRYRKALQISKPMREILPLLDRWFTVAAEGMDDLVNFFGDFPESYPLSATLSLDEEKNRALNTMCYDYYARYLTAGFEFLESLTKKAEK